MQLARNSGPFFLLGTNDLVEALLDHLLPLPLELLTGALGREWARVQRELGALVLATDLPALAMGDGPTLLELAAHLGAAGERGLVLVTRRESTVLLPGALRSAGPSGITSLVLGDPYYDAQRGHSYRAVSALLDNSASNVAVTFRVSGDAKGTWEVGARERRTVELGEAPWSGASYVVHTDAGTQKLSVAAFSAAPQCAAEWQRDRWYDHSATVSYGGPAAN